MSERKVIIRLVLLSLLTPLVLVSTACNTVKGAGKDIEKGGETIQDVSDDAKK